MKTFITPLCVFLIFCFSCSPEVEFIPEIYQPRHGHDAYTHGLKISGLEDSRLGRLWIEQSVQSLDKPVHIETPYAADFYVSDTEAKAFGYHFTALLGQKVTITLSTKESSDDGKVFIDLFRRIEGQELKHLASGDTINHQIIFEPHADQSYLLRIQPELLNEGKYHLEIQSSAALAFPVAGRDKHDIGSLFGAPRDGGRRLHHGIDIFARRHTPIIAPCDGIVKSTEPNMLGGEVIWMKDNQRRQVLYFAHLHDVYVVKGQQVIKGDTIGTVGNTGNAITTAPHLHFGIYSEGPADPYNFVVSPRQRFKRELADDSFIGTYVRTNHSTSMKSFDKENKSTPLREDQLCRVRGTTGMYYHVELPDGVSGYLSYQDIEQIARPLRRKPPSNSSVVNAPIKNHLVLSADKSLGEAKIHGLHGDFAFIKMEENYHWIKT